MHNYSLHDGTIRKETILDFHQVSIEGVDKNTGCHISGYLLDLSIMLIDTAKSFIQKLYGIEKVTF